MTSKNGVFASLLLFIAEISGLVELPRVEDNNILTTETAIRNTINTLFSSLQLKDVKKKPKLKEYSIVHNHLISFTLQDYNNLKEIAKLTRVDKKGTSNETLDFMTALNDLLNEDIDKEHKDTVYGIDDESVSRYVKQFLDKLESLKEAYGVNDKNLRIKNEVYDILKENEVSSYNDTMNDSKFGKDDEDAILGQNYFWKPTQFSRRVYHGDRIGIKHFPFMASIHIFNQFYCSGSIIKSDLLISASSCLQLAYNNRFFRENPAFLSVRVGSSFYNGGERVAVMEVYFHPNYDPKTLRNNLCILRLVRRINLKRKRVKKIDFDRNPSPLSMTTDGITILGWGARKENNIISNPFRQQLAFAVLDFYPLQECQEVYSKEYVSTKNFCAGFFSRGAGACNRDVGGPGVVEGKLMGVVSFGSPLCGTPNAPTVFTKVGYYTDWIEDIMEEEVPNANARTTTRREKPNIHMDYTPPAKTTFKMAPLTGTLKPLPVHEVDALRMLQNSEVFQDFLATMFGSKDHDKSKHVAILDDNLHDKIDYQDLQVKAEEVHLTMSTTPMDLDMIPTQPYIFNDLMTPLGHVEPEAEPETEYDADDTLTQLPDLTAKKSNTIVKIDHDSDLEKDVVNLIDNLDLKNLIQHISNLEGKQVMSEDKFLRMIAPKETKMTKVNDNVLTLLYLSDAENKEKCGKGDDCKGLSIDTAPFMEMNFRNDKNNTVPLALAMNEDDGISSDLLSDNVKPGEDSSQST